MNEEEITAIMRSGFGELHIDADPSVYDEVVMLADGFPHYAHLLGLNAVKACLKNDVVKLDPSIFHIGCDFAVQDAVEKYRDEYGRATATTQVSRYPNVLCACSYAKHDDRGVFKATDVVDAMHQVFKEDLTIQSVVPALGEFASPKRCKILEKVPVGNRSHYRFTDPMMRPFLRIKAQSLLLNY
jgi:hypothetical protein